MVATTSPCSTGTVNPSHKTEKTFSVHKTWPNMPDHHLWIVDTLNSYSSANSWTQFKRSDSRTSTSAQKVADLAPSFRLTWGCCYILGFGARSPPFRRFLRFSSVFREMAIHLHCTLSWVRCSWRSGGTREEKRRIGGSVSDLILEGFGGERHDGGGRSCASIQ